MEAQERRADGILRVPYSARVEVCGRDRRTPRFEAEVVDVSGRGLRVAAERPPEAGAPVVIRFHHDGQAIIAEGEVAWSADGRDGEGAFGLRFTAVDRGSVDTLKTLTRRPAVDAAPETQHASAPQARRPAPAPEAASPSAAAAPEPEPQPEPEAPVEEPLPAEGHKVRLHGQGLPAPMKARVTRTEERALEVGSPLDFLTLGRTLEMEDAGAGTRREARVRGVEVAVDPETRVPRILVSLSFGGAEDRTPVPTVLESRRASQPPKSERPRLSTAPSLGRASEASVRAAALDDEPGDDDLAADGGVDADGDLTPVRATHAAAAKAGAKATEVAKAAGGRLAAFGSTAASGFGALLRSATAAIGDLAPDDDGGDAPDRDAAPRDRGDEPRPRRTQSTSVAPNPALERLARKTRRGRSAEAAPPRARKQDEAPDTRAAQTDTAAPRTVPVALLGTIAQRRFLVPAAVAAVAVTVGVVAFGGGSGSPAAAKAVPSSLPASGDVVETDDEGNPIDAGDAMDAAPGDARGGDDDAGPDGGAAAEAPGAPTNEHGVVAKVPLFGKMRLAAKEPAELPEVPDDDPRPTVPDEKFRDAAPKKKSSRSSGSQRFGRGRVRRPWIHRIRLDAPGGEVKGAVHATGFTVVVPGRKAMESGAAIARRDSRIVSVKAANQKDGAHINFKFKGKVPGYRVRLRKDFVEILISENKK